MCKNYKRHGSLFCSEHIRNNAIYTLFKSPSVELAEIIKDSSKYIASPWNSQTKKIMSKSQYDKIDMQFKESKLLPSLQLCLYKDDNVEIKNFNLLLCQSHGGDLYQHSQWSSLQIIKWFIDQDPIIEDLDLNTALIAAFFHDIGKGGDCIETCEDGSCWYDMYSSLKYAKSAQGDYAHTTYSGDMIMGNRYYTLCASKKNIDINELIKKDFNCNVNVIALAAYMHWEFGKLNIPGKPLEEKVNTYLDFFNTCCAHCSLKPSKYLLQLCIAVGCADISAGTNSRLLPNVYGIVPEKPIYYQKDPWVAFGMDKMHLSLRSAVIKEFLRLN